jgi:ribosomal protein S18 acetylase RimI-like enzyme
MGRPAPELVVRAYEPRDRAAVRAVCYRTGYLGEPIDWQWRDQPSFADVFCGYDTDAEPESAFVLEVDGTVAGYLLGCVDSRRAWSPGAVLGRHIVRRGLLWRPRTAGVIWHRIGDAMLDVAARRVDPRDLEFRDPRWPAHLRIDLLPYARGRGAGRQLVTAWFDRLRSLGVGGCHLQTTGENTSAVAFFEALGFRRRGPVPVVPGLPTRAGERLHLQAMVIDLPA